jgi:hypothetical protein
MVHEVKLAAEEISLPEGSLWARLPMLGGIVGLVALGGSFAAGLGQPDQLYHSYLTSFYYFLTIALGALFFVLVQFATRAGWSVAVRRVAEHVAGTLPLFALLFVPILLGFHHLYEWSHEQVVAGDHVLQHKQPFLNSTGFVLRSVFYVAAWALLGWFFRRASMRQDEGGDPAITRRLQSLSAPALIVFALTLTFAGFDWIMSLDPHWYSTVFGVYLFAGSVVAIIATLILLLLQLQASGVMVRVVSWEHYHDLGKFLFAFTVFWAYIAFSQFMLIWYGNIPEETAWFKHRWGHGWEVVSVLLAVGHFGLPFLFLLSREVKRRRATLLIACSWLLVMHYVDIYWLVMPSLHGEHFQIHWLDAATLIGVGGLFVGALGLTLRGQALVPVRDPRLAESLAFENA